MLTQAIQICLLLQGLQTKYQAAKADGLDRDEIVDLVVSFLAGLVDILTGVIDEDVMESAMENVDAIRDRVSGYRGQAAKALDKASECVDVIFS